VSESHIRYEAAATYPGPSGDGPCVARDETGGITRMFKKTQAFTLTATPSSENQLTELSELLPVALGTVLRGQIAVITERRSEAFGTRCPASEPTGGRFS
jgi:hypothetical protein